MIGKMLALTVAVVSAIGLLPAVAAADSVTSPAAEPAAASGFATSFVDIPATGGITLGSMVMQPRSPGPHPLAVVISAWGGGRTQNIFPARELANRGYVVVAYGARGFGESTGEVEVAGPDDITDVSTVIDWALAHTASDPNRIGVSGVSYGAGIGLIASGFDKRIKAVATSSGWSDMVASLQRNDTRSGLAGLVLYLSGKQNGRLSPETDMMLQKFLVPRISDEDSKAVIDWSRLRSPITYIDRINANHPAVLNIQTWSETVFPPGQMMELFDRLTGPKRSEYVPGDHASTEYGGLLGLPDTTWTSVFRWFDAYVAGTDTSIKDEPPFVVRSRPGLQKEQFFASWAQAVGTPQRAYLGRGAGTDGTLGPATAPAWTTTIASNADTLANGGFPLTTYALEAFTGAPPTNFMVQIDRNVGAVWNQPNVPATTQIAGRFQAHLTVTPPAVTGTVIAYVYDVNELGVGSLISYMPYSWKHATPNRSFPVDLTFEPTEYTLGAGHHLSLVLDSKDPLFLDWNNVDGRTGIGSTAADPSWLDVPVRSAEPTAPTGGNR